MRTGVLFFILGIIMLAVISCVPAQKSGHQGHEQGKRILFYRNPMNPQITSAVPMKDEMGMDYVPVYEKESGAQTGEVAISSDGQKLLGVKTETVRRRQKKTAGFGVE